MLFLNIHHTRFISLGKRSLIVHNIRHLVPSHQLSLATQIIPSQSYRSMATKQVYQFDEQVRVHPARIIAIERFSSLATEDQALFKTSSEHTKALQTDETIFYVQGGGQPCDTGLMTSTSADGYQAQFNVEAVRYGSNGTILHFGHFGDHTRTFEVGEAIEQYVDSDKRDLHSRIHSAGHIVSLATRHLASTTNKELDVTELKAQHYPGVSFVDFRGIISSDYKDAIQTQANQFVSAALQVKLCWFEPDELGPNGVITVEGMPIVAGADGKVRVVDIVGAGAYPCGGTHVPDSSFIGPITIRSIRRQKGVSKISYSIEEAKR